MLDRSSQQKFAHGCIQAATGYATAATAAYTDWAAQALDFWCTALSGLDETPVTEEAAAEARLAADRPSEPPFGMALADWCPFPWFDPRRYEQIMQIDAKTPPALAMMAFANMVPLRGTAASWPFAQVMIQSGVPRAVAWPAAEANAAALEAADLATRRMRQVMASYHTENGFASVVRASTPSLAGVMAAFGMAVGPGPIAAWA